MIFDYETAQKMAKTHECKACGHYSRLAVRNLKGQWDCYCPVCKNTTDFGEIKSITKMWKENPGSVPLHAANKLEKKYGGLPMSDTQLAKVDERQMIERITTCQWAKDMTSSEKRELARLATTYQLDPFIGELVWYQGKPYISFDGHTRIAMRDNTYQGMEIRPMTPEEKIAWGVDKQPYAYIATVYKSGMRVPATAIGTADPLKPHRSKQDPRTGEWIGGNPVERERPWAMARVRAGNPALKQYFPHKIPNVGSLEVDAAISVDKSGNIIDGTFRVVPEDSYQGVTEVPADTVDPANVPATEGEPQEPLFPPQEDPVSFFSTAPATEAAPTARELIVKRIDDLCLKMTRSRDEAFYTYFQKFTNVEWDKATDDQLDHFLSHMTDVYEEGKQKKREKARSG